MTRRGHLYVVPDVPTQRSETPQTDAEFWADVAGYFGQVEEQAEKLRRYAQARAERAS